jgi:hypothetical protein
MPKSKLKYKPIEVTVGGLFCKSYLVSGTINGRRVGYQSADRNETFQYLTVKAGRSECH